MEPSDITYQLLKEITDGFSEERKLGDGSYGKVYRGVYKNGEEIAIKVLHFRVGNDEQFQNEFDNLMMLNHKNVVRLVGYCYETRRRHMDYEGRTVFAEDTCQALCFEYMHNGSLQKHLSDECSGLGWFTRYKIIKGICEGLKYLHEGFKEPIYHLDLKPDNILLDKNMEPKLADFGLSKFFSGQRTRITQSPIGTIGYLPLEYLMGNIVSNKLDIYSLGVVIIKIIAGHTGRSKSLDMSPREFIDLVQGNWRDRLCTSWSGSLLEAYSEQVKRCTQIALNCVENDRHKRPYIVNIIDELNKMEITLNRVGLSYFIPCQVEEDSAMDNQTIYSVLGTSTGDYLISNKGDKVRVLELVGKTVLLYFSSKWYEREINVPFLAKLVKEYTKIKEKNDNFEIIFISGDEDQNSYDDIFSAMPWLAIPFEDEMRELLVFTFKICIWPSLIAISPTGEIITRDAKTPLLCYGADAFPFSEERLLELGKKMEEMAKGWPAELKHELHDKHELVLMHHYPYVYICDGCEEDGSSWFYRCNVCNFDLHPRCALREEKMAMCPVKLKNEMHEERNPVPVTRTVHWQFQDGRWHRTQKN